MNRLSKIPLVAVGLIVLWSPVFLRAQSPAVTDPERAISATAPVVTTTDADEAVKVLQQVKAANDDTLKKQEAALQRLDEMQKAADQLKIFSKRG